MLICAIVHAAHGSRAVGRIRVDIARLAQVGAVYPAIEVVLGADVAQPTYACPERPIGAARAPGPASTGHDRHVVISETVNGSDDANQKAKKNVKAVVAEIEPARRCDKDGEAEGHEGDGKEVDGWRRGLSAE